MPDAPGLWMTEYAPGVWTGEAVGEQGYSGVPLKDQVKIDWVAALALSVVDEIVFGDWQPPPLGLHNEGMMSNGSA